MFKKATERDWERFWSKVDKNGPIPERYPELGPCHVWTGQRSDSSYGRFGVNGRNIRAHRWLIEQTLGRAMPEIALCCHRCDNRPCVNLQHFFIEDTEGNARDAAQKGRMHSKLTPERAVGVMARCLVGKESKAAIARSLGVGLSAITTLWSGATWSHVWKEGQLFPFEWPRKDGADLD